MDNSISIQEALTLPGLFRERVRRTPDKVAYQYFDVAGQAWLTKSWAEMAQHVARWQSAMQRMGLQSGDRVSVMLHNCIEWVLLDQAALGLGLVVVPLYVEDRPDNVAYITKNAEVKLLVLGSLQEWEKLRESDDDFSSVKKVVSISSYENNKLQDQRLISLDQWILRSNSTLQTIPQSPNALASIVYTSGTTGKSKGVMLSHKNILSNVAAGLEAVGIHEQDLFLSFLPLSHTLERTIGYYLPMMAGAKVAYTRSIAQLGEDLQSVCPTALISVPRIYERVYSRIQEGLNQKGFLARFLFQLTLKIGWQRFKFQQQRARWFPALLLWPLLNTLIARKVMERLGGQMRVAICGGAPLPVEVSKLFISLGLPLLQGYGLTEASPVVSVNRVDNNVPESIGQVLSGIKVRIGEDDELQTSSDSVMLGYWNNPEATAAAFTHDQWLRTGDKARIDKQGFIYITGRIKEILVLANGEKVPPADMEMAISLDRLFDQVMVIGEGQRFLVALLVLNNGEWRKLATISGVNPENKTALNDSNIKRDIMMRCNLNLKEFPGYAQIRGVHLTLDPWTVENDLITPTFKLKRNKILEKYNAEITKIYSDYQNQLVGENNLKST